MSVGNPFIGTTNFAMWPTQEASYATFYFQYVVSAPFLWRLFQAVLRL